MDMCQKRYNELNQQLIKLIIMCYRLINEINDHTNEELQDALFMKLIQYDLILVGMKLEITVMEHNLRFINWWSNNTNAMDDVCSCYECMNS